MDLADVILGNHHSSSKIQDRKITSCHSLVGGITDGITGGITARKNMKFSWDYDTSNGKEQRTTPSTDRYVPSKMARFWP